MKEDKVNVETEKESQAKGFPAIKNVGCPKCNNLGYTLDFILSKSSLAALSLCDCAKLLCNCGNEQPFYAIVEKDETRNSLEPCSIYPLHRKIRKIVQLFFNSELPHRYIYKFYNIFEFKHYEQKKIIKKIDAFLPSIWEGSSFHLPEGIFLTGKAGTGKTLLATIIINELIYRHAVPSLFLKTTRSLDRLRDTYNEGSTYYGQGNRIENYFKNIPVLVLDDLGAQKDSTWVEETLYDIIDHRYEQGFCTIVTSNLSLKGLEDLGGGRIASRLTEMCKIIEFPDKDYRKTIGERLNK